MTTPPDWRHERKFLVEGLSPEEVVCAVRMHPAHFRRAHPARFVNNLYLDTLDRRCLVDSVDGLAERVKYRIRWYGALLGRIAAPVLEVKTKSGVAGCKQGYPVAPFDLRPGLRRNVVRQRILSAELPALLRERLAELSPALVNRYRREYWVSVDGALRLTLDTELEFRAAHGAHSSLAHHARAGEVSIVELKYAIEHDLRGRSAASRFPFRLTKSSKYVSGVERLFP